MRVFFKRTVITGNGILMPAEGVKDLSLLFKRRGIASVFCKNLFIFGEGIVVPPDPAR